MFQYKDERCIQVIQDFLIFNSFHLKTVTLSKIIRHLTGFRFPASSNWPLERTERKGFLMTSGTM